MLCQKCGEKPATAHIYRSVNGVQEDWMLCDDCAAEMGYNELSFFTGGFLGSLFGTDIVEQTADRAIRCPVCGTAFEEIARTGLLGCADCYRQFSTRLAPTIEKLHGKAAHVGKTPKNRPSPSSREADGESELERLKRELAQAIDAQEFERAAVLRDAIRDKEGTTDEK